MWAVKILLKWSILVLIVDQVTKMMVMHTPKLHHFYVLPFLNLHLAYNKGAAFGMFGTNWWARWMFIILAIAMSIVLVTWALKISKSDKLEVLALGLILGGAFGNLFDRIRFGFVIDFIDFHIKHWHWYTFNIADSAIFIGAVILIGHTFLAKR